MEKSDIIKAGNIAKEVVAYAKSIIKKDVKLLEIADKIEGKIVELGGKPAFPVNLSINEIVAHYTPSHDDETLAHGLLKVDIGVHVDGWIADTAFSVDLENDDTNKKLIEASEAALNAAIENFNLGNITSEIGKAIQKAIHEKGFGPVMNLGGHGLDKYDFHAEPFIPNVDHQRDIEIVEGLYAIEPFATNGSGRVRDGKGSGIYQLTDSKNVRSPIAREILHYIIEEYKTLPFCSRWLVKEFGTKALFGLKQLEDNGNLHNHPQLLETPGSKVSQAEHTILIEKNGKTITTM